MEVTFKQIMEAYKDKRKQFDSTYMLDQVPDMFLEQFQVFVVQDQIDLEEFIKDLPSLNYDPN